jgi:DHA2 family multidrug resistance protein
VESGIAKAEAQRHAYGLIYQTVQSQSQTLAYIDTYMVLAIGASIMFLLAFIIRKNDPHTGGHVVVE